MEDLVDEHGVAPVAAGPGAKPKVVDLVRPDSAAEAREAERERTIERFARGGLKAVNEDGQ